MFLADFYLVDERGLGSCGCHTCVQVASSGLLPIKMQHIQELSVFNWIRISMHSDTPAAKSIDLSHGDKVSCESKAQAHYDFYPH